MSNFIIQRVAETPNSTWSDIFDPAGKHIGLILERGLHNPDGHPRIPAGQYPVTLRKLGSSEFDKTLISIVPGYRGIPLLGNVPGRTNIECHPANKVEQLLGCLAPASSIVTDANGDFSGTASRAAFATIYDALLDALSPGDINFIIKDIVPEASV